MSVSDAWFHRIKAAQRDLIRVGGGIERAAEICSISKTQMGRFNNAADPDLMPLQVVAALEAESGRPFVTAAMAAEQGRRLTDPQEDRAADVSVMAGYAELMRQNAEVVNALAVAVSDGMVTPVEAQTVDRALASMQNATQTLRESMAVIKARGATKAALSIVPGEGA